MSGRHNRDLRRWCSRRLPRPRRGRQRNVRPRVYPQSTRYRAGCIQLILVRFLRRKSSERIFMESISNFDDTLPLPDEVEREFLDNAGEDLTALAWLAENDIDP